MSDRQSDASFLVHHFLSLYLRGELSADMQTLKCGVVYSAKCELQCVCVSSARCRVLFLGLVQSFNHYSAISQRMVSPHFTFTC